MTLLLYITAGSESETVPDLPDAHLIQAEDFQIQPQEPSNSELSSDSWQEDWESDDSPDSDPDSDYHF